MVPPKDVTLIDAWFVSGMCAMGGKAIVNNHAFVAVHRVLGIDELTMGQRPGTNAPGMPFRCFALTGFA